MLFSKAGVIVLLHRESISVAEILYKQGVVVEAVTFDPHVYCLAHRMGLSKIMNVGLLHADISSEQCILAKEAWFDSLAVNKQLAEILNPIVETFSECNWMQVDLGLIANTLVFYKRYWELAVEKLLQWNVIIPLRGIPQIYNVHSFLPAVLLGEQLLKRGGGFQLISYGEDGEFPIIIPDIKMLDSIGNVDIVAHVPTVGNYLCSEISSANKKCFQVVSPYWHADINNADKSGMKIFAKYGSGYDGVSGMVVSEVIEKLMAVFEAYISKYIKTQYYVKKQADRLLNTVISQFVLYEDLVSGFRKVNPRKLVLSNVDVGYHGPLVSASIDLNVPLIYVPHAKMQNARLNLPGGSNAICLHHPFQGALVSNVSGDKVPGWAITYPETLIYGVKESEGIRCVGIILNCVSNNAFSISGGEYISNLRRLIAWCVNRGVDYVLRERPDSPAREWLSKELGIDEGRFEQWSMGGIEDSLRSCDVCIMYDMITTGVTNLLNISIPVIQVSFRETFYIELGLENSLIIPKLSCGDAIMKLDEFYGDPENLLRFRGWQYKCYSSAVSQAVPLRYYL